MTFILSHASLLIIYLSVFGNNNNICIREMLLFEVFHWHIICQLCDCKVRIQSCICHKYPCLIFVIHACTIKVASLRQRFNKSIAPGGLAGDRRGVVPASGFSFSSQEIWKVIKENKDLDLPAHKVNGIMISSVAYVRKF